MHKKCYFRICIKISFTTGCAWGHR